VVVESSLKTSLPIVSFVFTKRNKKNSHWSGGTYILTINVWNKVILTAHVSGKQGNNPFKLYTNGYVD
jgi:hypothetical protein